MLVASSSPTLRRSLSFAVGVALVLSSVLCPFAKAVPHDRPVVPWFSGWVGRSQQVVGVTGDESGGASVSAWEKINGQWQPTTAELPGWIGSAGLTHKIQDDVPATPVGVFPLSEAFGTDPQPPTALPYRQTDENDWWVGDVKSPLYNQFAVCEPGKCPFSETASEQLDDESYSIAVVMDVNPRRIRGAGNAYFLHVAAGAPTEGCVSMEKSDLSDILAWLRPGAVIAVRQGTNTPPGPDSDSDTETD